MGDLRGGENRQGGVMSLGEFRSDGADFEIGYLGGGPQGGGIFVFSKDLNLYLGEGIWEQTFEREFLREGFVNFQGGFWGEKDFKLVLDQRKGGTRNFFFQLFCGTPQVLGFLMELGWSFPAAGRTFYWGGSGAFLKAFSGEI